MSASSRRSAASMSPGVVSLARQTVSIVATVRSAPCSDRAPVLLVGPQQPLGVLGSLRARLVLRQRARGLLPLLHDRVADLPLGLDLVVAGEERGVAAHRVED